MMQAYGFSIQTIIVAANSSVVTGFRGDFIRNMETSGGVIYLGVDGQPVSLFPEAASYRLPAGMEFKEFKLENRSNTDITVQVAVALGEVGYSALQTSATLDVNIVGGNPAERSLYDLPGILKEGASRGFCSVSNSKQLVSAASNVNGLIIRTANLMSWGAAPARLSRSDAIVSINDWIACAVNGSQFIQRPIFLEAGYPLYGFTGGTSELSCTWDLL